MLYKVSLFALLAGCVDSAAAEHYASCEAICEDTEASCGSGFITDECTTYCAELPHEQLDDFEICASCFSAVACDPYYYAHVCYPSCNI